MVGAVQLLYDNSSEVRGAPLGDHPLPVLEQGRERIVMLEFTNLKTPPAPDAQFEVTITKVASSATVWRTSRSWP